MRRIATNAGVVAFFLLAAVGLASGVPPFVCSLRALVGAGVTYGLVTIAGLVAVCVLVDLLRSRPHPTHAPKEPSR